MANSDDSHRQPPHIALFPSAGMGHLTPILRLAALLASRSCTVTLVVATPTVSAAESTHISAFFSAHPHINRLEIEIPQLKPTDSTTIATDDPFFIRWLEISRSVHFSSPLLSSLSPPLSAIFSDFSSGTSFSQIADDLCIPNYLVFTTCARFLSLVASLPSLLSKLGGNDDDVEIPDLPPFPKSSLPPPFFNPNHFFTSFAASNARSLPKAKGLFLNTFEKFESETITALNNGRILSTLPPVLSIGPLEPYNIEKGEKGGKCNAHLSWLDEQRNGSVVYISFGSRTAMSKEQITEIANGLERSGCAFFWVLKGSKVDKEDTGGIQDLLGESFIERTKNRGIAVKGWVKQEEILSHPAIGGFVSHCGWNSVMEAARHGIPVLAWPFHGDQKVNAEVVEKAGLGIWVREWGWGVERLIGGEEIGEKVREMMSDEKLRRRGREIAEEAMNSWEGGGSSEKALMGVLDLLKATNLGTVS